MITEREMLNYGIYFGYPRCCIMDCILDVRHYRKFGKINQDRQIIIGGKVNVSGFIPCKKHRELIRAGSLSLSRIILPNRMCNKPFIEKWADVGTCDIITIC